MQTLMQDIHFAFRQLRRAPGFAFTVALTLALTVGVSTAVFCVIDTVIVRPLPYANPDRIMAVDSFSQSGYSQPASWPSYQDERQQAQAFSAFAGYNDFFKMTLQTSSHQPVLLDSVHSTDNFFQVFGVPPLLGRTFLPGEEQDGRNEVVVLSYNVWQSQFGGDRGVVGRPVTLDGRTYTVIGVMPPSFRFPLNMRNGIYTPHLIDHDWMHGRGNHWMRTVARIKDGFTREQAQADLSRVFANIGAAHAETDGGRTVNLESLSDNVLGKSSKPLWILVVAAMAVLAIGCVNIAGLLLVRGVKREREMAMRAAVGAGRMRLVRQVLTEGLVLALAGAAGGIALAWALLAIMRVFLTKALERGADVRLNWTVLAAAVAIAIFASLVSSLYPAMRGSSVHPALVLKAGGNSGTARSQHRLRAGFIITQVALTMVLLVVSGLLIRSVTRYRHADLGFDPTRILTTDLNFSPERYQGRDIVADFYTPLVERVSRIPGVRAGGVISITPIRDWGSNSDIHISGQPPYPPHQEMLSEQRFVSSGYYDVFGIPLRRGRALTAGLDHPDNPSAAVVVNEAFVKKFMPAGLDAVGQQFDDDPNPEKRTRIVGVVGNVRQDIFQPPLAEHDYLIDEIPLKERNDILTGMSLVVRFDGQADTIVPALRAAIREIDPTVPFHEANTLDEIVGQALVFERMESWLFGVFAGLALVLALVGLYGLISHEVELETRNIGVRMALGASRRLILVTMLRRVAWMMTAGAAAGLVLAALARKIIGMVIVLDFGKESSGLALLAVCMVAAGLVASLVPARRAASIDPMQALRNE
jgi:predicted permease